MTKRHRHTKAKPQTENEWPGMRRVNLQKSHRKQRWKEKGVQFRRWPDLSGQQKSTLAKTPTDRSNHHSLPYVDIASCVVRCEPFRKPCRCENLNESPRKNEYPPETTSQKLFIAAMKRNKIQVRKRKVTRVLGLLTRANAIRCRARGLSLIPPDDGIGGVGYCGADPGNWDTWSPWPTHSYCRFLCSRICGSNSKGSSRAI